MDFSQINPVAFAALTFAVVGVVELVKRLLAGDYKVAAVIAVAGVAGAVLAPFSGDINWFTGMLVGLNASGVITAASYLGSK